MARITPTIPIVNDGGFMAQQFRLFIDDVFLLFPIVGSGSPEGIVAARQWQSYIDEDGASGSIKYIKKFASISGDDKQGWVLE